MVIVGNGGFFGKSKIGLFIYFLSNCEGVLVEDDCEVGFLLLFELFWLFLGWGSVGFCK